MQNYFINWKWNKYQLDPKTYEKKKKNLNHLVDPSFQEVTRFFILSFENENGRASYSEYYLPKVEIKDYDVKIDGKNFFDQPINNDTKRYEDRKIATGQGDDCTIDCLLDYPYLRGNYKMVSIDLSKQQTLNPDPRAIQQNNFTVDLDRAGNTTMFFII